MNRILFVLLFALILFLIDWYSFQLIKAAFQNFSTQNQRIIKVIYWSISGLTLLLFFYYHFGHPDFIGKHTRTFILSFIFINVLAKLILAIFALIDDIQRLLRWTLRRFSKPEPSAEKSGITRSEFIAKTGIVVAMAPIVSLSWGIISGAHDYRVRRIKLPIKGLPQALNGLKMAQISDIHAGSFWNKIAVKGGVEMLMAEKPDLVFFTGDLVNNKANEMNNWGEVFGKIKAPLGTFSVFGNHDYGDYVNWPSAEAKAKNLSRLAAVHRNMGWNLLMNENQVLEIENEKLAIIGVENWSAKGRFPKYGKLNEAMKGLPETSFSVLLSHDPSHWQAEVLPGEPSIDLTLSGHTHGMQFGVEIPGFKWSPVQYVYKEWAGLYQSANQYLYVNRGFGYIGYPGRVGILPEISIFTLETA